MVFKVSLCVGLLAAVLLTGCVQPTPTPTPTSASIPSGAGYPGLAPTATGAPPGANTSYPVQPTTGTPPGNYPGQNVGPTLPPTTPYPAPTSGAARKHSVVAGAGWNLA